MHRQIFYYVTGYRVILFILFRFHQKYDISEAYEDPGFVSDLVSDFDPWSVFGSSPMIYICC